MHVCFVELLHSLGKNRSFVDFGSFRVRARFPIVKGGKVRVVDVSGTPKTLIRKTR